MLCIFKAFSSHRLDHHRDQLTSSGGVCFCAFASQHSHLGDDGDDDDDDGEDHDDYGGFNINDCAVACEDCHHYQ